MQNQSKHVCVRFLFVLEPESQHITYRRIVFQLLSNFRWLYSLVNARLYLRATKYLGQPEIANFTIFGLADLRDVRTSLCGEIPEYCYYGDRGEAQVGYENATRRGLVQYL